MPVAIAGMHRSGTSMIARLLAECGLDLGSTEHHLPPAPDNPEGFFEHRQFVELNERLLARLSGIWREPPMPAPGWESDPELQPFVDEARRIPTISAFRDPWGWKDPRTSLTLPFWRLVWPDLRVIVCVRHPLETAYSLLERDHLPIRVGLGLWETYYRRVVASTTPEDRVVVHYAAFFVEPETVLRRMLAAVSMPARDVEIRSACAAVSDRMRHSRLGMEALEALGATASLCELYDTLSAEAGYRPAESATALRGAAALADAVERLDRSLDACVRRSWTLLDHDREVTAREAMVDQLEANIAAQRSYIEERERLLGELQKHLAILGQRVVDLEERLSARRHRYADSLANAAWKVLHPFRNG